MRDQGSPDRTLAYWLGGLVLAALAVFLMTGGELGGTKRVAGDGDLPQVASPNTASSGNTGSR